MINTNEWDAFFGTEAPQETEPNTVCYKAGNRYTRIQGRRVVKVFSGSSTGSVSYFNRTPNQGPYVPPVDMGEELVEIPEAEFMVAFWTEVMQHLGVGQAEKKDNLSVMMDFDNAGQRNGSFSAFGGWR